MSDCTQEIVSEAIRITRAQERVGALLMPMNQMDKMIEEIIEIAPELRPELAALYGRLSESCEHLRSALAVLQVKIDLL